MISHINYKDFRWALEIFGLPTIVPANHISGQSRLVHDLGIVGDDFDEFISVLLQKDLTENQKINLQDYIPTEISRDGYYVEMARSSCSKRFSLLRSYYVGKIRSRPLTIDEFLEIVSLAD